MSVWAATTWQQNSLEVHIHTANLFMPTPPHTHTHTYTDAGKSLRAALGYLEGAMLGFKDPGSQHLQQHVSR